MFRLVLFFATITKYLSAPNNDPVIWNKYDGLKQQQQHKRKLLQDINFEPVYGPNHIALDSEDPILDFESVLGQNDLRLINQTDMFPFRAIGRFENLGCTGFLIGPQYVLTAGHCVWDTRGEGRWFTELEFSPGMNGEGNLPFGVMDWDYARVTAQFAYNEDVNYDYGLVVLKKPFTEVCQEKGYEKCDRVMEYQFECLDRRITANLAGYRDDIEGFDDTRMWVSPCFNVNVDCTQRLIDHTCDSTKGMAGAPLWVFRKSGNDTFINSARGIHIGKAVDGREVNQAVLINEDVVNRIIDWILEGDSQRNETDRS